MCGLRTDTTEKKHSCNKVLERCGEKKPLSYERIEHGKGESTDYGKTEKKEINRKIKNIKLNADKNILYV